MAFFNAYVPPLFVSVLFFAVACGVYARARGTTNIFVRWVRALVVTDVLVVYVAGIGWLDHGVFDLAQAFRVLSLAELAAIALLFATIGLAIIALAVSCAVIVPLVLVCRFQRVLDVVVPLTAGMTGVAAVLVACAAWMGLAVVSVMEAANVSALIAFVVALIPVLVGVIALRVRWILAQPN